MLIIYQPDWFLITSAQCLSYETNVISLICNYGLAPLKCQDNTRQGHKMCALQVIQSLHINTSHFVSIQTDLVWKKSNTMHQTPQCFFLGGGNRIKSTNSKEQFLFEVGSSSWACSQEMPCRRCDHSCWPAAEWIKVCCNFTSET